MLRSLTVLGLALTSFVPTARGDVVTCPPSIAGGTVCLTGDVSDVAGGGPLVSGQVYYIGGGITVPIGETLTVEDGAIIKAASNGCIDVNGTLACGAAIFTSLTDDSVGGDTNGDGPTLGSPGDWLGIVMSASASASLVQNAEIRFAGIGLRLINSDPICIGLDVNNCSGAAMDLGSNSLPVITNSSFTDNEFAIQGAPIEALAGFANNGASGNTLGDYINITNGTVSSNLTIGPASSLGSEPFGCCSTIVLPAGVTLTMQPGTVIKFGPGPQSPYPGCGATGLEIDGTLDADGVTFTSLFDDTVGGDTNRDGSLTVPAPGDWGLAEFLNDSDATVVKNTLIRYGGDPVIGLSGPTILLSFTDLTLDNVVVEHGLDTALRLNQNSFPTVTGCTFRTHELPVDRVLVNAVAGFTNNSASMNTKGDYMELLSTGAQTLSSGITDVLLENSLNQDGLFVIANDITVGTGATLNFGQDVVAKWTFPANHLIVANGTFTATGTTFTSLPDDEILGDSNKDGGATQPAPGDWVGIRFGASQSSGILDGAVLRYAGQKEFVLGAVETSGTADPLITGTTIERSETAALDLTNSGLPTVSNCLFDENDFAVTRVPIAAVPGFSNNTATNNTDGDYLRITNGLVPPPAGPSPDAGLEIGPANALLPNQVFVVAANLDVPAGARLSMLGGTIIKWDGLRELDVDGTVQMGSGIGSTVVLTSCNDDSIGGDTKKDGFTEGAPGDWINVAIDDDVASILQDVLVRFAGAFNSPSIDLVTSAAQLTDVRIEDGAAAGLDLSGSSAPLVTDCTIDRCTIAVVNVPINSLPGFSGNTASGNSVGDYQRVTNGSVSGDLHVQTSQSMNGGPIVFADNVDVFQGNSLTLDGGVVFKFEGLNEIFVDGTLTTLGSSSVTTILTSLVDDIAGDTNKDGAATTPAPGSWVGIELDNDSDASVLSGVRMRYAGTASFAAIRVFQSDPIIVDCTIEFSADEGLNLSNNSFPEVRRTAIQNGLGIAVESVPLAAIPNFTDVTGFGNDGGDFLRVNSSTLSSDVVISRFNAVNGNGVFVINNSISLFAPRTLTLRQGTIFKFQGPNRTLNVSSGDLIVEGTGLQPVVLTSRHDDAIGGDTFKDGAATVPMPADWDKFQVGALGSATVEHLHVRYAGLNTAAVLLQSDTVTARSIRTDFSASDGFQITRLGSDAVNFVAFQSAARGMDVTGGTFDVVHATIADSGGAGIRRSGAHAGTLWSSISFGNAGAAVTGYVAGEVFASNVGPTFAGVDGNIDADPLFVDQASGNLALGAGSPCVETADFATALGVVKDHREASRILDDGFDGTLEADMGAYERAGYELTFGGEPRIGTVMSFTASGAEPGLAVYALGLLGGETLFPPYGFTLFGAPGTQIVLGVAPTGQPIFVPMPASPLFVDILFGIQALGVPNAFPTFGHLTNLYRGRLFV